MTFIVGLVCIGGVVSGLILLRILMVFLTSSLFLDNALFF